MDTAASLALEKLVDAAALYDVDGVLTSLSMCAGLAIAAGLDSPHLRELAGEPPGSAGDEPRELLRRTMTELGVSNDEWTGERGLHRALRVQTARHLGGLLSARQLCWWVVGHYEWEQQNAEIHSIMLLDDYLDELEFWDENWGGQPREELEAEVTAAARQILASYLRE